MLNIGDFAFDTTTGTNVQVLEKINVWGYVSYKVFNPATGKVYKVSEEQLNIESSGILYDENYLRYVTLLSKIKNETAGGLLSSLSSGIIPLPHQLHVLNRAMETNNIRYILADEVGLGKTIEAGMIVKELKARGLVQRVLVVCPTGLVTQWASEMQEKFHERFQVILPSDYDKSRKGYPWPKVKTSRKKFEKKLKEFKEWLYDNKNQPAKDIVKQLNVKLVGYYRYYGVTFNVYKLSAFLHRVQQFLFKAMNRRGCRRTYTWNGFVDMLKCYPLAKPKVYYPLY